MRLKNKSAVITGAASGIGAATAQRFASEGAKVLLVDRDAERGEAVAADIAASGAAAEFIQADMGEDDDIAGMIERAVSLYGGLDILHNNTAGAALGSVDQVSLDDWERSLKQAVTPYYRASHFAIPHMRRRGGGAIVNTASISGISADYGFACYNTAKAAVIGLTRNIAIDYARENIRCNAVCPGIIFTPPFHPVKEKYPEFIEQMAASVPMGRFGKAEEVANVVLFLASDEASFVTGATIVADGGRTAWTGTPSMADNLRGKN